METRTALYPEITPYASGVLALDGGRPPHHRMYWEQAGNAGGVPVVFLHGGPGAGASPDHRRFFDPAHYRIVIFDQRGAGRSTPRAETRANTTAHLIADIEHLRTHLGIARWMVFGGSWGSTLALAYAEAHPTRVLALVLRGIFLARRREIAWFLDGIRHVFPEPWRAFAEAIPATERDDLLSAYRRRLDDPDPAVHGPAARAWAAFEAACSTLRPAPALVRQFAADALPLARLEAHYFAHGAFLDEGQLLDGIAAVRGLPGVIVQGRYDMVCPIETADALHRAWPEADYHVIDDAGHAATEPGIRAALVGAMETLKRRFPHPPD